MNSREFTFWLAGYLDSIDPTPPQAKDVAIIRAKMAEIIDESGGFSDEEVENIRNSTIGIDRSPSQWWSPVPGSAADVKKMDPVAVSTHRYDEDEAVGTYRG